MKNLRTSSRIRKKLTMDKYFALRTTSSAQAPIKNVLVSKKDIWRIDIIIGRFVYGALFLQMLRILSTSNHYWML